MWLPFSTTSSSFVISAMLTYVLIGFALLQPTFGRLRESPMYSNEFAVHVPEGDATADLLAAKHGFVNNGQMSKTSQEWKQIAEQFDAKWNFPHCLGALDGKHIVIQSPIKSGSEYYNYKGTFSVVLMALVDANYCFSFVDIGCQGRISDGGVFRNTVLFKKLEENSLKIPEDEPLPNYTETYFPYVFVADDAFAIGPHILKPYKGLYEKGSDQRIFNYRLSRARRVVENVFGIMASVFRVFRRPMLLEPEKVSKIAMTCVLLHNFLRRSKDSAPLYVPAGTFDTEKDGQITLGTWRQDQQAISSFLPLRNIPRKPGRQAEEIRKSFCNYFKSTGKVPWQDDYY